MSELKELQEQMKALFEGNEKSALHGQLEIKNYSFSSDLKIDPIKPGIMKGDLYYHELVDRETPENFNFTYPVVKPVGGASFQKGILLFHGLNEKSWDKYLAWAGELALKLNRPVILFPIAYHMNRAPKSWSDPRSMRNVVQSRLKFYKKNESTFANAALSTRLGSNPEQFVFSGVQSYYDVWQLLKQIKDGKHPLFESGTGMDIFAYSIGAFLAEIMFVCNPDKLLTRSRMFLFAGGPTFDTMIGNSRYIMDRVAFRSLLTLKRRKVLKRVASQLLPAGLPDFENTWNGFLAMLSQRKGRSKRKVVLEERGNSIYAMALEKDKVMPAKMIVKTLKGKHNRLPIRVDVIDFPYDYTHENPFPMKDQSIQPLVNRSFNVMINKAIRFYTEPVKITKFVFQPQMELLTQTV